MADIVDKSLREILPRIDSDTKEMMKLRGELIEKRLRLFETDDPAQFLVDFVDLNKEESVLMDRLWSEMSDLCRRLNRIMHKVKGGFIRKARVDGEVLSYLKYVNDILWTLVERVRIYRDRLNGEESHIRRILKSHNPKKAISAIASEFRHEVVDDLNFMRDWHVRLKSVNEVQNKIGAWLKRNRYEQTAAGLGVAAAGAMAMWAHMDANDIPGSIMVLSLSLLGIGGTMIATFLMHAQKKSLGLSKIIATGSLMSENNRFSIA